MSRTPIVYAAVVVGVVSVAGIGRRSAARAVAIIEIGIAKVVACLFVFFFGPACSNLMQ
jgi:hypothetical protein